MDIQIMSRSAASQYCLMPHKDSTIIISINNVPTESFPATRSVFKSADNGVQDILFLFFNDEEKDEYGCMSVEQAEQIANFIQNRQTNISRIIVHCQAGVSRSAGVAGALMKIINGDDSAAFSCGRVPNMTCYRRVMNAMCDE